MEYLVLQAFYCGNAFISPSILKSNVFYVKNRIHLLTLCKYS